MLNIWADDEETDNHYAFQLRQKDLFFFYTVQGLMIILQEIKNKHLISLLYKRTL